MANVPSLTDTNPIRILTAIRDLFQGRSNAVGTLTLNTGASTTVVSAQNCGRDSQPILTPLTATAAAELGNGTLYVASVSNGSFTLAHSNSSVSDRRFGFVCLG